MKRGIPVLDHAHNESRKDIHILCGCGFVMYLSILSGSLTSKEYQEKKTILVSFNHPFSLFQHLTPPPPHTQITPSVPKAMHKIYKCISYRRETKSEKEKNPVYRNMSSIHPCHKTKLTASRPLTDARTPSRQVIMPENLYFTLFRRPYGSSQASTPSPVSAPNPPKNPPPPTPGRCVAIHKE